MKKTIPRILGVALTVALLVGLFAIAAPVAAGTQSWTKQSIPSTTGMVLAPGINYIGPMAMASDGSAIYAAVDESTALQVLPALPPGTEATLVVPLPAGTTLASITSISWLTYLVSGYIPHVDLVLDYDGDGVRDDVLVAEGAYANGDSTVGWATNTWLQTWQGASGAYPGWSGLAGNALPVTSVHGNTAVWLWTLGAGASINTLAAYQTVGGFLGVTGATSVLQLEIEVDNWVTPSSALVSSVSVNGIPVGVGTSLVKSTDGGRTWTALALGSAAYPISTPRIVDIVCSSIDPNTVYVTDGFDIWRSDDAGVTWAPRTNLFNFAAGAGWYDTGGLIASGMITAIDIGYLAQGPHIFAAVSSFGLGDGGVFVCYEWQLGMPWDDMQVDNNRPTPWGTPGTTRDVDVYDIKVDPANFVTTQMIMAVAEHSGSNMTCLTHHYDGAQWNSMEAADAELQWNNVNSITNVYRAQIWLPDGFNASLASGLMQYFVGIASGTAAEGDVYLVAGAAVPGPSPAFDLNIGGAGTATHITGLDGEGGVATASMLASGYSALTTPANTVPVVYSSQTGGAVWLLNLKRPTGGASIFTGNALSSVLVMPGYATSGNDNYGVALVGTHGADCGVHITNDFGASWNGISLIATSIAVGDLMQDLEVAPDGTVYISTDAITTTGIDSIWRYASNWERVYSSSLSALGANDPELIEVTPDGTAVFIADVNAPFNVLRSLDNGQTWQAQVSVNPGGAITSWLVVDASTVYVGGAGVVYQTTTNGVVWFTRTCAVGTVQSLAVDATTGDLLAGGILAGVGTVALSQDGGITWTVATQAIAALDTTIIVTFGHSYATTGQMFATGTDTSADAGVFKRTTGSWSQIDRVLGNLQSGTDDVLAGTGLVSAPGITGTDMVYAADGSAAREGVYRIKANRSEGEQMRGPTGTIFAGLWYAPGSNVLWTIDTVAPAIYTYTDVLAVAGSGVAVSLITPNTCAISWNDLTKASTYLVVVNTTAQTNFYTAVTLGTIATQSNTLNTATVTGLVANTTYYVSVWGATSVSSFLFDGAATSFTTTPTAPVYTPNLMPFDGQQNVIVENTPFAWDPVMGATSYLLQISTDPGFATILAEVPSDAEHLILGITLDYSSAYYWRVRAVTATGFSTWVSSIFTTEAEPVETVVVEETTTQITLTVPTPETPAYIWAIILVGGILTIAVIVLIVRTRRVV